MMADNRLTIEQSMEESKVQALREIVAELRAMKLEVQQIRVQVTNVAANQARKL